MLPIAWDAWSSWVAGRLLAGSLQGAVAVAAVWLVCRRFPTIPASVRAQAWWLVSLGLLLSLSALPSLPLPLLPAPAPLASIDSVDGVRDRLAPSNDTASPLRAQPSEGSRSVGAIRRSRAWVDMAVALWMAGVIIHAYRLVSAYVSLRGVVRRSVPPPEDDGANADRVAIALALKRTPRIRLSHEIEAPLAVGILRPVVLIPSSAIAVLSLRERAIVIGHELAHIRRRDLLLAWVPAIVERLFFFHPLARLAAREYAVARELACDALVLHAMDIAPHEYGCLLVRLGIVGLNPVFTVGGSSPSVFSLKRRLEMLHDVTSIRSSRATIAPVAFVALLAVLPLRVVARTPAIPQGAAVPVAPAAETPAKPVPAPKPQPARPAAPRPTLRPNAPEGASFEQAIAEQLRLLEAEEALSKTSAELRALYAQERKAQLRRQVENIRRAIEESMSAQRRRESAVRESEVQTTKQFLESRLRELMVEQESVNEKQRQLEAEIKELRERLERVP